MESLDGKFLDGKFGWKVWMESFSMESLDGKFGWKAAGWKAAIGDTLPRMTAQILKSTTVENSNKTQLAVDPSSTKKSHVAT